ncbi:type IV pilus modification PilV family protein [Acidithiobacillus sp.]
MSRKTQPQQQKHNAAHPPAEGGFNLIEVMVAIAIFAFGILALAYLQAAIVKLNSNSQYLTTANNAASQMTGYLWTALGDGSNTANILQYDNTQVSAAGISTTATGPLYSNVQNWQQSIIGLSANGNPLPDTGLPQGTGQISNILCSPIDGSNGGQAGQNQGPFGNNNCSPATPCACTASIVIRWSARFGPESYTLTVPIGF